MSARAFPATLEAAQEAEAWAGAQCEGRDVDAFAVALCLEELFVNAVTHGGAREIRLALEGATLEFRDDGVAFDPTQRRPKRLESGSLDFEIGGFGVGLVAKFAQDVAYARADGWNVVTLAFAPSAH